SGLARATWPSSSPRAASYSSGTWSAVMPSAPWCTSVASGCSRISAASASGSFCSKWRGWYIAASSAAPRLDAGPRRAEALADERHLHVLGLALDGGVDDRVAVVALVAQHGELARAAARMVAGAGELELHRVAAALGRLLAAVAVLRHQVALDLLLRQ